MRTRPRRIDQPHGQDRRLALAQALLDKADELDRVMAAERPAEVDHDEENLDETAFGTEEQRARWQRRVHSKDQKLIAQEDIRALAKKSAEAQRRLVAAQQRVRAAAVRQPKDKPAKRRPVMQAAAADPAEAATREEEKAMLEEARTLRRAIEAEAKEIRDLQVRKTALSGILGALESK